MQVFLIAALAIIVVPILPAAARNAVEMQCLCAFDRIARQVEYRDVSSCQPYCTEMLAPICKPELRPWSLLLRMECCSADLCSTPEGFVYYNPADGHIHTRTEYDARASHRNQESTDPVDKALSYFIIIAAIKIGLICCVCALCIANRRSKMRKADKEAKIEYF